MEIVLVRGVGLHTVLGISIDGTIEQLFRNTLYELCKQFREILVDKALHEEFIQHHKTEIDPLFYNDLDYLIDSGKQLELLEKLSYYGNPTVHSMPVVNDIETCNMSFAGL